jgi:DNA-directed RNA polymerase alpha subunit
MLLKECIIIYAWRIAMKIEVLLERLASPAQRALQNADIKTLEELAKHTENEVLELHGIGKNAITVIKTTLDEHGLSLKE